MVVFGQGPCLALLAFAGTFSLPLPLGRFLSHSSRLQRYFFPFSCRLFTLGALLGEPMPKVTVEIDTRNFSLAMIQLAQMTGHSRKLQVVIKSETGAIYNGALKRTGKGDRQKITQAHTLNNGGTGKKRLVKWLYIGGRRVRTNTIAEKGAMATGKSGGKYWDPEKKNPDWILAKQKIAKLKNLRLRRIGLAKWSWVEMARTAGLTTPMNAPGYVRRAGLSINVPNQSFRSSFSSKSFPMRSGFFIKLHHAARAQAGAKTRTAFIIAMNGRTSFFRKNVKNAVFDDANTRSRKYGFLNHN